MVCKRCEISDRAGAAVATATLNAFGIVTESESKYVIECSKLIRNQTGRRTFIWSRKFLFM